jgi:branched-chain amino acid transport system permease protein
VNLTTLGVGIAAGIGTGSVYALIAVSFTLIISSTSYFNFALESVVSLGGIMAYLLAADGHVPLGITAIVVCVGGAGIGAALEFLVHRPFVGRSDNVSLTVLLASIGASIAIDAIAGKAFGASPRTVPSYVSASPLKIAGVPVSPSYLVMFAVVVVVTIGFEFMFRRTGLGRTLRATQADKEGASLLGLNVTGITVGVFAAAGALAALAGFLITPVTDASSTAGSSLVVASFAALAIGGFGSFRGAIAGGLVVGLIVNVLPIYITSDSVTPILLAIIVATLVVRPQGLFGRSAAREL